MAEVFYQNEPPAGPMYLLTPAILKVCCKAIPCQINYLIDEAVDVGKGCNAIISMKYMGLASVMSTSKWTTV